MPDPSANVNAARLVHHMPVPALLTDERGEVLASNVAAAQWIAEMAITLADSCLRFPCSQVQAAWQQTLHEVGRTGVASSVSNPADLHGHWKLHVVPWSAVASDDHPCRMRLVFIEHHGGPSARQVARFAAAAHLSQAEAEVLALLLLGRVPKEIARERGSSLNTVRSQIARIRDKTGTHSMRDLATRVAADSRF